MPSDSTVARLRFDTTVSNGGLRSGMNQAAEIVKSGVGKIGASLSRFGGFGGAFGGVAGKLGLSMPGELGGLMGGMANPGMMGLGAAGGLYATVQAFAAKAKELQLSSSKLGIGVEQYQQLERAAKKSGLSIEETAGGMNRMRRAVFEANSGNKSLANTFKTLGINSQRLMQMDAGQQIEAIAQGLSKIGNANQRRGVEEQIFGRSGGEMDPMLMQLGRGGGLGQFKKWYDLSGSEARILAEQKNSVGKDVPGIAQKVAAIWGRDLNTVASEVGGWMHGHMGGGREYLKDQDTIDSIEKHKSAALSAPVDTQLHGFGGMAMQGSQAAYELQMAEKYGVVEAQDRTNDLLEQQLNLMYGNGGEKQRAV